MVDLTQEQLKQFFDECKRSSISKAALAIGITVEEGVEVYDFHQKKQAVDTRSIKAFRAAGLNQGQVARALGLDIDTVELYSKAGDTQLDCLVSMLNERFFVVGNMGGKCRILWHEEDPALPGRKVLGVQTFADFRNRYDHIEVSIGAT